MSANTIGIFLAFHKVVNAIDKPAHANKIIQIPFKDI